MSAASKKVSVEAADVATLLASNDRLADGIGEALDLASEAFDQVSVVFALGCHFLDREAKDGFFVVDKENANTFMYALGKAVDAARAVRTHLDEVSG